MNVNEVLLPVVTAGTKIITGRYAAPRDGAGPPASCAPGRRPRPAASSRW